MTLPCHSVYDLFLEADYGQFLRVFYYCQLKEPTALCLLLFRHLPKRTHSFHGPD
jgi:hypothetical protein